MYPQKLPKQLNITFLFQIRKLSHKADKLLVSQDRYDLKPLALLQLRMYTI